MITLIENQNIALSSAEAIVNASNSWGYMGGRICIKSEHRGVAESIQYISQGAVEKLSKRICRKHFLGYKPGNIFVTKAPNLRTNYIIHAVTMRNPGDKSKIETIKTLVPQILEISEKMGFKQVAIPLLGTGTGGLPFKDVFDIYEEFFVDTPIEFLVHTNYKMR